MKSASQQAGSTCALHKITILMETPLATFLYFALQFVFTIQFGTEALLLLLYFIFTMVRVCGCNIALQLSSLTSSRTF